VCLLFQRSFTSIGIANYMLVEGNRTTPSYVAFSSEERLIGDAAKNQAAMNPTNSEPGVKLALDNITNSSSV
jgi:molecular chaperone DnaK (HSP70)